MNKLLLVPTDYSKGAEHALNYAVALAKREKASVLLLHAFHVSYYSSDIAHVVAEDISVTQKRETKRLKLLCDKISKTEKIECNFLIRQGLAVDVILNVAKEKNPQMVIMGTKGASWLKEMIVGSNTAKVIEKAKCPVIAVPENATYEGINRITYATDYHMSDITALKKIVEIAKPFGAEIIVLHVSDEELTPPTDEEMMKKFRQFADKKINYGKIRYSLARGKYLEKVLQDHIKKEKPDLLAMSTHYRGILDKIFGTSTTKIMAYHSQIPLLAFHHKQESVVFI
jgi:nucleotide-binding universal stress UspA family protein